MSRSRREFLTQTALGVAGVAAAVTAEAAPSDAGVAAAPPPGAPPAFGTSPSVGPGVSAATFAEAEKLVQVQLTPAERAQAASNWREIDGAALRAAHRAAQGEARAGAGARLAVGPGAARASPAGPTRDRFVRSKASPGPLPGKDDDIAFAPVTALSRWIESRALTSERLTRIYLERLRALRPEAQVRHHADARAGAGAGPARRRGDRRGQATAARCTASPGAPRTWSTRPASPPPTAPSRSATACPRRTPPWWTGCTAPARCWWPS